MSESTPIHGAPQSLPSSDLSQPAAPPFPTVKSMSAYPRRRRASGAFWILLVLIVGAGLGVLLFGGLGAFGGY